MFITFEGIEGSSKTTQAGLLSKWLEKNNIKHLLTKEPGSVISKECQQIRHLLLSPEYNISSKSELFLYLADRSQHVQNHIKPTLKKNEWVISDRYWLSTYVYQGYGRKLLESEDPTFFYEMIMYAADGVLPDITFVMDLPVEIGLKRAKRSNTEFEGGDRMELETISFHKRLRKGFLEMASDEPSKYENDGPYIILDARKSIEELHIEVIGTLRKYL